MGLQDMQAPPVSRLLLVDATGLYVRASRAARSMKIDNALEYLFFRSFCGFLRTTQPTHVIAAWDGRQARDFRRAKWALYKAGRPAVPEDSEAFTNCMEFIGRIGIESLRLWNFEADDIIAWAAQKARKEGIGDVDIYTDDRDLYQVMDARTRVHSLHKAGFISYHDAEIALGYDPALMGCVRALAGDHSDGIPGVPGLVPRTAVALLRAADWRLEDVEHPAFEDNPYLRNLVGTFYEIIDLGQRYLPVQTAVRREGIGYKFGPWCEWHRENIGAEARELFASYRMSSLLRDLDVGVLWG
jgi:5'-3' exonuclease